MFIGNLLRGLEQMVVIPVSAIDGEFGTVISGGSRNFWWGGDLKHKTSKIRMSSPKLRVIFRPKSEIQTFFSPKSGDLQKKKKKKRSSPKLKVIFRPDSLRLGRWGGCIPKWSRIIRNRG